jgi:hypothetical protein
MSKNIYRTLMHGRDPIKRTWAYYRLDIASDVEVDRERAEQVANIVRGATMNAAKLEKQIGDLLPEFKISLEPIQFNLEGGVK